MKLQIATFIGRATKALPHKQTHY